MLLAFCLRNRDFQSNSKTAFVRDNRTLLSFVSRFQNLQPVMAGRAADNSSCIYGWYCFLANSVVHVVAITRHLGDLLGFCLFTRERMHASMVLRSNSRLSSVTTKRAR